MLPEVPICKTYILRVWQVERDALPAVWASIEDSQTGQQKVFAGLPALLDFLAAVAPPAPRTDTTETE
jgi:hypothetical protein